MPDMLALARPGYCCILIDRLRLPFLIGILRSEQTAPQDVVVSLAAYMRESGAGRSGDIADTVSYADLVEGIRAIATSGRHIPLVEQLAEEIAELALADARIDYVQVAVTKPDIIAECASVGVVIERSHGQ